MFLTTDRKLEVYTCLPVYFIPHKNVRMRQSVQIAQCSLFITTFFPSVFNYSGNIEFQRKMYVTHPPTYVKKWLREMPGDQYIFILFIPDNCISQIHTRFLQPTHKSCSVALCDQLCISCINHQRNPEILTNKICSKLFL